ncbi:DNA-directed RNA polymerase subunit alpha C-terminal domain-containing protein [Nonomuraea bangladeshensis]|uniref:DNA-directed RNA polymerase subunit alpha C-terminal domain-containing protein n=1 Tax=Nonomuraea bangladeshensis TaxID=404385 RepID=UPI003C2D58EF
MLTIADLIAESGLPATTPVKSLKGLTWHVTHPLEQAGITTLADLAAKPEDELLDLPGFGPGRRDKLRAALAD